VLPIKRAKAGPTEKIKVAVDRRKAQWGTKITELIKGYHASEKEWKLKEVEIGQP